MTIKQYGGVFGRNPTFNNVTIEGTLTFDGDIDINSDLTIEDNLYVLGSVGIGTTSPSSALDVTGSVHLSGGVFGGGQFSAGTTGDGSFFAEGAQHIFRKGSSGSYQEFGRFATSGNLGIGTSSPAENLHISSSSGSARIRMTSADGSDNMIVFGDASDSATGSIKFDHSDNSLAFFGFNNSERMRIDASGRVGIGIVPETWNTTFIPMQLGDSGYIYGRSSQTAMEIGNNAYFGGSGWTYTTTNTAQRYIQDSTDNAHKWFNAASGTEDTSLSWSERMRIDASGNVGIGTSTVESTLHLQAASAGGRGATLTIDNNAGSTVGNESQITFLTDAGASVAGIANARIKAISTNAGDGRADITFTTWNGSAEGERMRIDASGNLLVGKTADNNAVAGVALSGDGIVKVTRTDWSLLLNRIGSTSGSLALFQYDGGTVGSISVTASATAYNTSSDQRLKDNIADADDAGSKIDAIQVRKFDWKADGSHQDYGMVAQELLEVAPESVSAPEDPEEMMGVDYSKLVPMMLKEIQSLRARVAQLES